MIGDFLGLTTTATLTSDSIASIPTTFGGAPLSGLSFVPDGSSTINVVLPQGALLGGSSLGRTVNLRLGDSDSDGVFDQVVSPISSADQAALNTWLGQGGSVLTGSTGTFQVQDASIEATTGGGTADLLINGQLLRGGIAPNSVIRMYRPGVQISRYKAGEQTSPIPRDRFLFNTSWFDGVNGPGGLGKVTRFVPGFEKTLDDGNASVELRLPFASTFDTYQATDINGNLLGATDTEIGNLVATYKELLLQNENFALSAGLSVELPTSADLVFDTPVLEARRSAESIELLPFLGSLYTRGRFFTQSFLQFSFDTNGETMVVRDKRTNAAQTGTLQDASLIFGDISGGWWFYRNEHVRRSAQLSGLAGLLELHMTQTLQDTDYFVANVSGNSFQFGTPNGSIGVANLTAGLTAELGRMSTVTLAYVTPLTDRDAQFNREIRLLFNYYPDGLGSGYRNVRRR